VISDAHEGIKAAVARVLSTGWQHCRTHFVRNMRDHAARSGRRLIAAAIGTAFAEETSEAAHREWRRVSDRLRPNLPKLSQRMDEAEMDVLAYKRFPPQHWPKIGSTNPIERANAEIKRRTNVVGVFPNEAAILRLVGAVLMEQHNDWAAQDRRYMTLESLMPISDDPLASPGSPRAGQPRHRRNGLLTDVSYTTSRDTTGPRNESFGGLPYHSLNDRVRIPLMGGSSIQATKSSSAVRRSSTSASSTRARRQRRPLRNFHPRRSVAGDDPDALADREHRLLLHEGRRSPAVELHRPFVGRGRSGGTDDLDRPASGDEAEVLAFRQLRRRAGGERREADGRRAPPHPQRNPVSSRSPFRLAS